MKECQALDLLITPYLDEECSDLDRLVVQQHLRECAGCRIRVEAELERAGLILSDRRFGQAA